MFGPGRRSGRRAGRRSARRVSRRQAAMRDAAQPPAPAPAPPPAQPPAAPVEEEDYMAELEKLAQLKEQGILTDEEFEAKKKQVLGI